MGTTSESPEAALRPEGRRSLALKGLAPVLRRAAALAGALFMPPVCLHCGGMRWKGTPLCLTCHRKVERLDGSECPRCGSPACREGGGGHAYWAHPFDSSRFLYRMGPEISAVIHGFKYRHMARHADFLAAGLRRRPDLVAHIRGFDALVPVPLHGARRRERGYNQAERIAEAFSRATGVPSLPGVLARNRATGTQTKLGKEERMRNLDGAFVCPDPAAAASVAGRRLLLVDDVFTTGSTASACAGALRKAGCASVGVISLALVENREAGDDFVMEMEAVAAYLA